jgi:hypothetical protein
MNIRNIVESGVKHHNPSPTPGENIDHYMYMQICHTKMYLMGLRMHLA